MLLFCFACSGEPLEGLVVIPQLGFPDSHLTMEGGKPRNALSFYWWEVEAQSSCFR